MSSYGPTVAIGRATRFLRVGFHNIAAEVKWEKDPGQFFGLVEDESQEDDKS